MTTRTLIRGGTLVTLGDPCRVLPDHDLLLHGDRIARLAPTGSLEGPWDRVIEAEGRVVMPGLVNAHMHLYSTLVRGLGKAAPSRDFQEVLRNLWWRLDRQLSLEDVEVSAEVALLDAVRRGTTTLVDHHASPGAVRGSLERIARAVRRTGLRACLCYEVSDRDGARVIDLGLEENVAFARACAAAPDPQLRALFGLHAAFTLSDGTLERAAALARELGPETGFHVHLAEAASDLEQNLARHGRTPVARLVEHGVLRPGSVAAHAVHLEAADLEALAASGAFVAHNPQSNLNNAVGIAGVVEMARKGVLVGLGTDAMTADMLEEARAALWAQRHARGDPSCGFGEVAGALFGANPRIAGRIFGLSLGEIRKGCAGDLAIFDYDPPTPLSDRNALGHVLFGLSQAGVDTTIVGGRVLMEHRKLRLDIDEARVNARARELARRLWQRM